MKWARNTDGDLAEHWLVAARRDDQPLPVTVLAKWRWYKRYSQRAKLWYGSMEGLAIIASAAIPVAAAADAAAPVIATLGAVVLVATALRSTFGLNENWVEYSQIGYAIEREAALYVTAVAPYDTADAASVLVVRVEALAERGGRQWAGRRMGLENPQPPNAKPDPATPPLAG
ncbi:DUF4231 domain-containing protein [Actinophytocola oryzae]|uniref:Uncharacterized protein DUF4231 n=1 Tax=Actinophytocola oryzae TaxID=502181 RepID=A0A4R7VZV0_9PSEU|nr:DUF4231 domain-containing protein [Actinophytocola oryzae]TDV55315.1 uncharacterized protein DUF4231 [Actinophytocola oryzae]